MLDYLVVPIRGSVDSPFQARETVNDLWLEECLDEGKLVPIETPIHRPLKLDLSLKPCAGVVIGITNYMGKERSFISTLAECLGMISQEIFAKRDKGAARQSTHLICASAEGSKYNAAVKWKVPVVSKDWLLACLKDLTWVSEQPFLIGDSNTFTEGKPMPREDTEEENTLTEEASAAAVEAEEDEDDEIQLKTPKLGKRRLSAKDASDKKTPKLKPAGRTEDDEEEEEDEDIKFKTPKTDEGQLRSRMLELETPGMDIEKLRPKPIDFEPSKTITPNRYADSQPSQGTPVMEGGGVASTSSGRTTRNQNGKKRGRTDETLPFYLTDVKTPETPYGAFLGKNPSPRTKKFWKMKCDEMGK